MHGVSSKKLAEALKALEIPTQNINGILITHEHSDHVKGLGTFSKKYDIPVFANKETFLAMPTETAKIDKKNINYIELNKEFYIGDLKILAFPIPHDAANPCGYNIINNNKKISIATDIGHIPEDVLKHLENSCFALLESNYDLSVLQYSPYPANLKRRISGPNGHLSNENCSKLITHLMNSGLNKVELAHLSKNSNFPELAKETLIEELNKNNLDSSNLDIFIAKRDKPSDFIDII